MAEKESLSEAVASGDEYRILVATRNKVAEQLEEASGRDTAALAKQMKDLTEKITELERSAGKRNKTNPLEAARRAVRSAK